MPRHFTLAEAEQMLPEVDQALRDALFHKAEYQAAEEELNQSTQRIRMAGGSRVNPGPILATRARRDASAGALREIFERIEEMGVLIKDLDIGLIDFLTRYHGREVCLCWKLGEERIRFWHGMDEGFAGASPSTTNSSRTIAATRWSSGPLEPPVSSTKGSLKSVLKVGYAPSRWLLYSTHASHPYLPERRPSEKSSSKPLLPIGC